MASNETSKYKLSVAEGTEYKLSVVDGTELQLSLNGATGPTGPANVLEIGTVTTGETGVPAAASITGSSPTQTLNLTLPKGNTGTAATIAVGTTTTGAAGSSASVTNAGTSGAAVFNFTIPRGDTGATGAAGPNTVTTSTSTNLTGFISGNGTNISGATAASSAATANRLVLRSATGSAAFSATAVSEAAVEGTSTGVDGAGLYGLDVGGSGYGVYGEGGTGVYGSSEDGTGASGYSQNGTGAIGYSLNATGAESTSAANTGVTYHHKFGNSGNNRSAVERVRGWFVWFFGSFTGRLKTADITANREWTLPDASGNLITDTSSFDLTYTGTLPPSSVPILTTTPQRDALLGASGSQAATLRSGKWVTGISITGFANPTLDNLTTLSSSDIVGIRDSFILNGLTKLTTVSFPSLAAIGGSYTLSTSFVGTGNMGVLTSVSFPALASVIGSFTFSVGGSINSLATASFPALASIGGSFNFLGSNGQANSLTTLSFPALAFIGGAFNFMGSISQANSLTTASFPALASIGSSFNISNANTASALSLTTLSFPALVSVSGPIVITQSPLNALTALSFPALASINSFTFTGGVGSAAINSLTTISFPALVSSAGNMTINGGGGNTLNSLTTVLLGSGLKHINGDFASGDIGLDRHNAWSASTYYPSFTSFTAPASAFSAAGTSTTCTVTITDHGLQNNDLITVSGLTGNTAGNHNFNTVATGPVAVTRISSSQFSYTITATTQIATGTARIQRREVIVTPITKNGRKYTCTTAGTSGATEPTWPTTVGNTVTDGTAVWTCSEMSQANILSRLVALDGTNQTTTYGANRFINIATTTSITVISIATASGVATITTSANHGITTGTQVVISGCTGTALRYNGVWTVTSTGLTTLTATVPTDLNGVAGAGSMRLTTAAPQYTGDFPIASTSVVGGASDSHSIVADSLPNLRDSDGGTVLPVTPAGIYVRNGTTNGFAKYSCAENGWDLWYDTTTKRWANTPSASTGSTTAVNDYPNTPRAVAISSTSTANPAVITSSVAHGIATNAVFTVVIEGCSNAALNGSWTATATGATTFTIPVSGAAGATTNSGTVAVLNQTLLKGRLMGSTVASPIQGVQQIITRNSHGFSNGDFIHFYGAVGTQAVSINDLNNGALSKSITTAITVTDLNTFTCIRYSTTQPFIGSYSLTTQPHMRRPSVNDVAYYSALRLRSRGVSTTLHGTTGL
jgi:hypothetical protein